MIKDAIVEKAKAAVDCMAIIGGSATNDGGVGMLRGTCLAEFPDKDGKAGPSVGKQEKPRRNITEITDAYVRSTD